jgi:hypothetical protein
MNMLGVGGLVQKHCKKKIKHARTILFIGLILSKNPYQQLQLKKDR